jgi:hypothetical protein
VPLDRPLSDDPFTRAALGLDAPALVLEPPRESVARTLGECLGDPSLLTPPPVLVPYLAIAGRCTLLSGREKSGKSTLTAQLVADASLGRAVLGVPMAGPVTTLWYAIDEPLGDTARRFQAMDADPSRVIVNEHPRTVADLLAHLTADLAKYPDVALVVVDTLSRLLATVKTNASDQVEPVLWRLVDTFRQHGPASVLLYHTGKSGKEYRGSTAIGATVDEILTLQRKSTEDADADDDDDDEDDGRRKLVQQGRHLNGRVQLAFRAGRYGLWDELDPPRQRILRALEYGSANTRSELVKRAKVKKRDGLAAISELIEAGEIVENADGLGLSEPVPAAPGSVVLGNQHGTGSGSRFPSVPPEGTKREPAREPESGGESVPVPSSPTLVGWKREPVLDVAI